VTAHLVSLLGFGALVLAAVALDLSARLGGRPATADRAVAAAMRTTAGRVAVLAVWVWVGVHVLAR
jgi:hypothetical protein